MVAANTISKIISSSLTDDVHAINYIIKFANSIMIYKERKFGKQHLRYKLETWKKTGTFDMMNNISENITLVQLMDSLGNADHAVSVVGNWIFD